MQGIPKKKTTTSQAHFKTQQKCVVQLFSMETQASAAA